VTPFAAAALIAVMTVAAFTVNLRDGFLVTSNGYECNLALMGTFLALAGIGAGEHQAPWRLV
jgi:uncharacterized membrane protein YphA (DoxX/SURF4 family)